MYVVGPLFTEAGGGPASNSEPWHLEHFTCATDDEDVARQFVRELAKSRVDGLKLFYAARQSRPKLKRNVMEAIVDEGHKHGLPVVAHVYDVDDTAHAVHAGVDGLVHAPVAPNGKMKTSDGEDLPSLLNRFNVPVTTTARTSSIQRIEGSIGPSLKAHQAAGVTLLFGTDFVPGAGSPRHPREPILSAINVWRIAGFSNAEIIQAITGHAAKHPMTPGDIGTIEPGKLADIIIVNDDPLTHIESITSPQVVIKGGRIVIDKRWVPTVEITRPVDGSFDLANPMVLHAKASASAEARVLRVEFLVDGRTIGVDTEPPYEVKWKWAEKGDYRFTARVYDSSGRTEPSTGVAINVGIRGQERSVRSSADDAEEFGGGQMYLDSSDLELINDWRGDQSVGMRFRGIQLPNGATIKKAYLQFTVAGVNTQPTDLTIHAELATNAETFTEVKGNISSRKRTKASVKWSPEPWNVRGARSEKQRTPDLSSLIQEVVAQADWQEGNALVLIVSGSGKRVAKSYDGDPAGAPLLHIEYEP